jgi:threonine synthase
MSNEAFLRCIVPGCGGSRGLEETTFSCPRCGELLDVTYDWNRLQVPKSTQVFSARLANRSQPLDQSGVWRFRELLPFASAEELVTIGEGQTLLQRADRLASYLDVTAGNLFLQYEGLNPSGSFKDNGMAAAFTHARMVGAQRAGCASTGNTSASLALFCAATGLMRGIVFVGSGKIAAGKLAQALDHGALTLQIGGDFDDAMRRVREVADRLGLYLVNSINPFRLEGQKTIIYRVLEGLNWQAPDWIVVPGGNLGNTSAFGKALAELTVLGLIDRIPRLAVVNAAGANTFYELYEKKGLRWNQGAFAKDVVQQHYKEYDRRSARAATLASAIEINRPVNLPKALRALEICAGTVVEVTDEQILDAKAMVGANGLGCEPASAASVAGTRKLRRQGTIGATDRVVCILTGHALKDPTATMAYHGLEGAAGKHPERAGRYANRPHPVDNDLDQIVKVIEEVSNVVEAEAFMGGDQNELRQKRDGLP